MKKDRPLLYKTIAQMSNQNRGKCPWPYDNLPESLQNSERGEAMSEAIDALEAAYSSIEDALGSLEEAMQ